MIDEFSESLLKLGPSYLKKLSKQEVHEGYKKIICDMLMSFYITCMTSDEKFETLDDLDKFISIWVNKNIKTPNPEWNPGDCGL